MKRLILYVLIFFIAVALSPLLIGEKGYILIAMGDITVESTVVTASILLCLVFIGLLLLLKVFRGSIRLGKGAWYKVAFASKRKALRQFKQGVAAYILEDYPQAEKLLVKSANNSNMNSVAYLMAADSAQKQASTANTEYYLECLSQEQLAEKSQGLEHVLVTIKQQLNLKNYHKARALVDEYHQHIGHDARLLSLEIELSITEQRFDNAIEYLNKARKEKTILAENIARWESIIYGGKFTQLITKSDHGQLATYWQKIPRKIKQSEAVLLSYCQVLAEHQITTSLNALLLPAFKGNTSDSFLKKTRTLPLTNPDSLLVEVQKQLHKDNKSTKWLASLGFLAYAGQQYDMSVKAFTTLFKHEDYQPDHQDIILYSKALMANNQHQQASELLLSLTDKL